MFSKTIQVFEHGELIYGEEYELLNKERKIEFNEKRFKKKIDDYYDKNKKTKEGKFFNLETKGISFNQYVGVLKLGDLTIEILPKVDETDDDKKKWQGILYSMFKKAGNIDGKATGFASLNHFTNNFLELYISYFIKEVEYLLHTGLVKKYRKREDNLYSLKGKLNFSKHISKNITHQERFYVTYTVYDSDNIFNRIFLKAIKCAKKINTNPVISSRIETLLINFPEVQNIEVNQTLFRKLVFNRKTKDYVKAISLAKFILLNLHPDLKTGESDAIAIMFDMNMLYQSYVAKILKQELRPKGYNVESKNSIDFWKFDKEKYIRVVKPDIIISKNNKTVVVLDAKWKKPDVKKFPEIHDLRQMFVYNFLYFKKDCDRISALVYPSAKNIPEIKLGTYENSFGYCDVIYLPVTSKEKERSVLDIKNLVNYIKKPPIRNPH